MDPVFDAQFRIIKDAFAREGVRIEVAYTPRGEVDYVYRAGRLLARNDEGALDRLGRILPGIRRAHAREQPAGDLVVLSIEDLERGHSTVPETLDRVDAELGAGNPALRPDGVPLVAPEHVLHIARLCSAIEPEVPSGDPAGPWPPPVPAGQPKSPALIGVCDTGLLESLDFDLVPWLRGVTGEPDPLGPVLPDRPDRQRHIPAFTGHGTFVAGVARCLAPEADVIVADHFSVSGAELESRIVDKIDQLVGRSANVINVSAGTYTRNNWTPLGFEDFHRRHPGVTLVAAAGNDTTDRKFYPAAFDWAVSVGALAADQQHRAWFSNFGDSVDVYALGEGVVNAYATGLYTYQEPPKRPALQTFGGLARWDGTSFSAPLVAGIIAARMMRTGDSAPDATRAVLSAAAAQAIQGVGPALFPGDVP